MRHALLAILAIILLDNRQPAAAQDVDQLLQQASEASQRREPERSILFLNEAIKQEPNLSVAYYLRGRANFCAAHFADSVADFDKHVQLEPRAANRQWERGIACYYAHQFAKGARQFEDYQKYHDQDVENSVWRYLCVARDGGVDKARSTLLPITNDGRVPMMQIYSLYQGKIKPDEVLTAASHEPPNRELANQRLFYAHLYVGLWHEAAGNAEEAKKHILEAEKHKIAHYMWDVAHVHAGQFRLADKQ